MVQFIQPLSSGEEPIPEPADAFDPIEHLPEQLPLPFPDTFDATDIPEPAERGRSIVFVDGASLFYAASQMSIEVDYAKLLHYFRAQGQLVYAFFYTGVDPSNTRQQSFLTWMRRNGYRVVTKEVTLQPTGGKRGTQMNVEIAVDMVRFAQSCNTEILISGDGDLTYAARAITYLGLRLEVIALRSMASPTLIQSANHYIDLMSIRDEIQKLPR